MHADLINLCYIEKGRREETEKGLVNSLKNVYLFYSAKDSTEEAGMQGWEP